MQTPGEEPTTSVVLSQAEREIEILRPGKFILLCTTTFGLYTVWWTYKVWRYFNIKEGLRIMPAVRATWAIPFIFPLSIKIKHFAQAAGYQKNYPAVVLSVSFVLLSFVSLLPVPHSFISLLGIVCYIPVVHAMNFALDKMGVPKKERFNGRQITLIVLGSIIWVFTLLGLLAIILLQPASPA